MDDLIVDAITRTELGEIDPQFDEFLRYLLSESPSGEPPSWFPDEDGVQNHLDHPYAAGFSDIQAEMETPPAPRRQFCDSVETPTVKASTGSLTNCRLEVNHLSHNPYSRADTRWEYPYSDKVFDSQDEMETPPVRLQFCDSAETPAVKTSTDSLTNCRIEVNPLDHNPYSHADTRRECPYSGKDSPSTKLPSWFPDEKGAQIHLDHSYAVGLFDSEDEMETPPVRLQFCDSAETPAVKASTGSLTNCRLEVNHLDHNPYSRADTQRECPYSDKASEAENGTQPTKRQRVADLMKDRTYMPTCRASHTGRIHQIMDHTQQTAPRHSSRRRRRPLRLEWLSGEDGIRRV
ncbi:uncharacterized protein [Antennarius striatus]|uniref:uncharacterized protein n=1 Tax=Antennarius striatus TaxID=241820 RepID=UPI0035B46C86